ncbi:MAG: DUF5715 family protein [Thermoanaerobaculia bacterium]|nr:DUF5715 family protein [Thermoanaerobaculia bacterium]
MTLNVCSNPGRIVSTLAFFLVLAAFGDLPISGASLRPSRPALMKQVRAARAHGYTHLDTPAQVRKFVRHGYLVPVTGGQSFTVKSTVSHKAARPEVKLFLQRLGAQYHRACGDRLVVTSLVRPRNHQPRNASPLSVHPTGMAMDLRVSWSSRCRSWLENTLLQLERSGVLEAARERHPPHYHVVLFPRQYLDYLERIRGVDVTELRASTAEYQVRRGDSLWKIARRHGTTVGQIREVNDLPSTRIKPGQVLSIPAR